MLKISQNPSAVAAVCQALADFLKAQIPEIGTALTQWPEPNEELVYPALSVYAKSPEMTPAMPYVIARGAQDPDTGLYEVTKVMGYWEFKLQLDLWADYKARRDQFLETVFQAFSQNFDVPGVTLKLSDYHGEDCHYSLDQTPYVDDGAAAERGEWRATLTVIANCRALTSQTVALMTTIENTLQTPVTALTPVPTTPVAGADDDLVI